MDRKIILELIRKDIDELQLLVSALAVNPDPDNILLNITISRVQTVMHELSLLKNDEKTEVENFETLNSVEKIEPKPESQKPQIENEQEIMDSTEKLLDIEENDVSNCVDVNSAEPEPQPEPQPEPESQLQSEPEPHSESQSELEPRRVFGEQFTHEPSLNERFSDLKQNRAAAITKPVTSIRKAIGLNDRFMYIRELFGNDADIFESTVDQLDKAKGIIEAISYLEQHFKWTKNEISLKFMELVKRRYEI